MNTLIITPTNLIIDDKITASPVNISVIIPNGHSYDIEEVIAHLVRVDEQKPPKKRLQPFRRTKRLFKAFKAALKEMDDVDPNHQVNKSPS